MATLEACLALRALGFSGLQGKSQGFVGFRVSMAEGRSLGFQGLRVLSLGCRA